METTFEGRTFENPTLNRRRSYDEIHWTAAASLRDVFPLRNSSQSVISA